MLYYLEILDFRLLKVLLVIFMELFKIFPLPFENGNKCILYQEMTNLTTGKDTTWKEIIKTKTKTREQELFLEALLTAL